MTQAHLLDNLAAQWASLGAMFAIDATPEHADLECLLLDTARGSHVNSRFVEMAVTWLTYYGDYVATHRLARLILDELEREHRPALGLILETAQSHRRDRRFNKAIEACGQAIDARPLYEIDRRNTFFTRLAEQNASALSRKWGRWAGEIGLKTNALRPAYWVAEHNPHLRLRVLCSSDVAASMIAEAQSQGGTLRYASELDVSRDFVASRGAVRDAINRLEHAGLLRREHDGRRTRFEISIPLIAEG